MTDEEMFQTLGALAAQARKAKGRHKKAAALEMGIADSTLRFFEAGLNTRIPQLGTLTAMEGYYGWRRGVLREFWDKRRGIPAGSLTLDMLEPEKPTGLLSAAHLSDHDLIAELQFRLMMRDLRDDQ